MNKKVKWKCYTRNPAEKIILFSTLSAKEKEKYKKDILLWKPTGGTTTTVKTDYWRKW